VSDRESLPKRRPREESESTPRLRTEKDQTQADTTGTLEPLTDASAQDWLGSNQDPDVLLSVPNLGVDHIMLKVKNLDAHVELHAKVLDLLELHVGADVSIEEVDLEIDNVRVQAMLKVKLEKVAEIVDRVMTTIDENPEILTSLTKGVGQGVEHALEGSTDEPDEEPEEEEPTPIRRRS